MDNEIIELKCVYCGNKFKPNKKQLDKYKADNNSMFCCSIGCSNRYKAQNNKGKIRTGSISSMHIVHNCDYCGKEFELSKNQKQKYLKDNNIKLYCSVYCRNKGTSKLNTINRPEVKCGCCGKLFKLSTDQLTRYNKDNNTVFYCSPKCRGRVNFSKVNPIKKRLAIQNLFRDKNFVKQRSEKIRQTNIKKYGYSNPFQNTEKLQQYWQDNFGVSNPSQLREVAIKKVITAKTSIASDGTRFDSSYERDVYEFCIRNNIPIEKQIPLEFEYKGKTHITYIDFKIDGILFECKGYHLLQGIYDYKQDVPINVKLDIYKKNNVILILDDKGGQYIPPKNSNLSNGLKYKNKCEYPLIGVSINLFRNPKFPYAEDRPKCFYKVRVDKKLSPLEAWDNEIIRWKMIKNRINYVGGYINEKEILNAMNVTRTCKQPSWFSKTYAKELIQKYITSDVIVDSFAGWGARCDACK